MSVYKPVKSRFYHYDFQFKGTRYSGSTMCTAKSDANAYEATLRKQIASGLKVVPKITLDQGFGLWWEMVGQFEGNAKTTEGQLEHLRRLLGATTFMHQLGFAEIERNYVARRRGEKAKGRATLISNASVNRELEIAGRVWAYIRKSGYDAPYAEWRAHRLSEPKERVRELKPAEEAKLFAELPEDLAAVAEFAMLSGQRRTAVIELLWNRVDLDDGRAVVRTKGTGKRTHVDHSFPLTPRMMEIIRSRPKVGPRVFTYVCERPSPPRPDRPRRLAGQRYPFSKQGWARKWRQALADAGIEDFRFHDLRHTAGTRILRATGNLKVAQKLLGHVDISTTARYAHAIEDDVRSAMLAAEKSRNSPEPAAADKVEKRANSKR
ncbi:tyrosine-type recombinase/integrase [Sphingomonas montanisoli]|uniref:Site-specific integrase n=1 Tax=Sphingomonas montanisoli TaxID=2606412 RepID=A0A5D9C5T1_9SPHN|nr:site-specific integrase [Sphingomonas montanisoli]TZG26472.1 site-specific integrase [Sphingomonas montanisoli]